MKSLATKLIISGILIIVLSGLEKVLIFLSFKGQGVTDTLTLKALTPSIVWNVTESTRTFGIIILIAGAVLLIAGSNFVRNQIKTMKIRNAEFEAEETKRL
ncbi:hypothetical protein SAMN05216312_104552 [Cohnella sp. OV330]|nr:hypothetical protein SAMN05216312_104552 [Cohnella sp. OV330]